MQCVISMPLLGSGELRVIQLQQGKSSQKTSCKLVRLTLFHALDLSYKYTLCCSCAYTYEILIKLTLIILRYCYSEERRGITRSSRPASCIVFVLRHHCSLQVIVKSLKN